MEKSDLILLDGKSKYPNLFVSMHRLGFNREVEKASKRFNLSLKNTAKEQDGTNYIGDINHEQALNINTKLNGLTLPPLYFADLLYQLIETIKGKRKTYDGNRKEISSEQLNSFYNEITEVRAPWRGEHLHAEFGKNTITYHKFVDGKFVEVTEELEDCLMQDRLIDMNDWLRNPTSQGLPRKKCKEGKLSYWFPREGAVARFFANSDWAGLDCFRDPRDSGAEFGVRYSVSAEGTQKISPEAYTPNQISSVLNKEGITGELEKRINLYKSLF